MINQNIVIKAEMTADRTLDIILAEYNVSKADVEIDGNYVTIYAPKKPVIHPVQVPQHVGDGDLWVEEEDWGAYTTNDKEGKFFFVAMVDEEGTHYLSKDGLCEYLETRAFLADKMTQRAFKTALELLNDKSKYKENLKKIIELLDDVYAKVSKRPSMFDIRQVDEKPWAWYVVVRAQKSETRSTADIIKEYQCPSRRCREENDYVEIIFRNILFPPFNNDSWVAEKPDGTFVTNDRSHSVFGYTVFGEYGRDFMNEKELIERLRMWLNENKVPSSVKDECAELQELLHSENPDMDMVLDLVNITREGGAFDGMTINKIPCII